MQSQTFLSFCMDFFQQHIQHVHFEHHQPFSRVQSTSTLVGCVESVDPQVFLCQSAACLDFICSRKLVVELPTRIILTVSMGIFASAEIYVKIINKHLSKPGPRSCTLRNWQVLSHPPFPGHTSLYSAAPKVSFLNQQGLLTCVCFPSESSVFSQMEQMNACRFLLLLLPQIERV